MAHPKRQHSKQRSRKRRTHQKIADNIGNPSAVGNKMGFNHRVDPITGYYKGKMIIDVAAKTEKKETKEK